MPPKGSRNSSGNCSFDGYLTTPAPRACDAAGELGHDETEPVVLEVNEPHLVVWSSLWPVRPDARIRFDLPYDAGQQGTDLLWTLEVDEPEPEAPLLGHMRKRLNVLINAELRYSFGQ